jgi:hypothetical protein
VLGLRGAHASCGLSLLCGSTGAIHVHSGSSINLTTVSFRRNALSSVYYSAGGGLYVRSGVGAVTLINCTLTSSAISSGGINGTHAQGAAVYLGSRGVIRGTRITGSFASVGSGPGAVFAAGARGASGAVFVAPGVRANITGSSIVSNTAARSASNTVRWAGCWATGVE